jgi:phage tail-like protein
MATFEPIVYGSTLATDPLRTFRFQAEFTPTEGSTQSLGLGWRGGFTSIDGLGINTQNIQYREGGFNTTVHQIPGMTTFAPVTFSRGVIQGHDTAINWMKGLFSAQLGTGLPVASATGFRVNIDIYVMDHPNAGAVNDTAKMKFTIKNAWITNLNFTSLDATNGAIMFETMTLVHEGLTAEYVTNPTGVQA